MIEYPRDLPPGWTDEQRELTEQHIRAELSAIADADDDPETNADDVDVVATRLPDGGLRLTGYLDAEPNAPYLADDHDPLAGVDHDLYAAEVAAATLDATTAATLDQEASHGTP